MTDLVTIQRENASSAPFTNGTVEDILLNGNNNFNQEFSMMSNDLNDINFDMGVSSSNGFGNINNCTTDGRIYQTNVPKITTQVKISTQELDFPIGLNDSQKALSSPLPISQPQSAGIIKSTQAIPPEIETVNLNRQTKDQVDGVKHEYTVEDSLRLIDDLKFFLATAPANWHPSQIIRRYYLNHIEGFISCVYWHNLFFITGTDIIRSLVYRFNQFGREIIDRKKFEEGVFSDLRNLKCNQDAVLEMPKSEFLEFLYKNNCLRTQKKQKVFFWFSVNHDKLFADALERDLKREAILASSGSAANTAAAAEFSNKNGASSIAIKEPALSFRWDESKNLYDQVVDYLKEKYESEEDKERVPLLPSLPPSHLTCRRKETSNTKSRPMAAAGPGDRDVYSENGGQGRNLNPNSNANPNPAPASSVEYSSNCSMEGYGDALGYSNSYEVAGFGGNIDSTGSELELEMELEMPLEEGPFGMYAYPGTQPFYYPMARPYYDYDYDYDDWYRAAAGVPMPIPLAARPASCRPMAGRRPSAPMSFPIPVLKPRPVPMKPRRSSGTRIRHFYPH